MVLFPLQIAYLSHTAVSHKAGDFLVLKPSQWEHEQSRNHILSFQSMEYLAIT